MNMAAGPSYPPTPMMANTVAVINPQFCAPYPVDLTIAIKVFIITEANFAVTDVNGNVMFKIKGKSSSIRNSRVLLDASDRPLLTLHQKFWTSTWEVFEGESSDKTNLLFSIKRSSSIFQKKTKLQVFLATNKDEKVCDYKVQGSWGKGTCVVYAGESSNIVAQMHKKKFTAKNILFGNNKFKVTVYPNTDYRLITSIFIIMQLQAINSQRR